MLTPPLPPDELDRLEDLRELGLLDTPPEERFDRLTRLLARLLDVPVALVTLVDSGRQWFKSTVGFSASATPRDISFCGHAILDASPLVVPDALDDERFFDNPLVIGEPRIRFYAGHPLLGPRGHRIGTLCAIDVKPRNPGPDVLAILRDLATLVTQQLHATSLAEALAKEAETATRLQRYFDETNDLVQSVDAVGQVAYANRAWLRTLGYDRDELASLNVFQIIAPEHRDRCRGVLDRLLAGESLALEEVAFIARDGRRVLLDGSATREMRPGGAPVTRVVLRNVTEARMAERRALRILQVSPTPLLLVEEDATIALANPAAEHLLDEPAEALEGRPLEEVLPGIFGARGAWRRTGPEADADGSATVSPWVTEARGRDAPPIPVEVSVSRLDDTRRVVTVMDLTAHRRAAADLIAARDAAQAASRQKSDFLTRMSHELRTPLNAILGFAQLAALDPTLPDRARENGEEIERAGRHLLALMNDVLDLARVEAGRLDLAPRPVSIDRLLRESTELVASAARAGNVSLEPGSGPSPSAAVVADDARLRQVMVNLLSNAVKYNRPGGTVRVSVSEVDGRLRISVADTGPGIPRERWDQLFRPFERLGAAHGGVEGTGIGLHLSRLLVEAMQGQIGFSTEVGRGSTFWIELPAATGPTTRDTSPRLSAAPFPAGQGPLARALYVEDDEANVRLMRRIFALRPTWELHHAPTAEAGLEMTRALRPELVLMDINLPGLDGESAVSRLRADPSTAALTIVGLSSHAMKDQVERYLAAGFSTYLTKPVEVPTLLELLDVTAGPPETSSLPRPDPEPARCILVADDHEPNRQLLAAQLPMLGFSVETASSGFRALELYDPQRHALVLTDLRMPGMDGLALARAIRASEPPGVRVPILAVTADLRPGEKERCDEAGIDDVAIKPLGLMALKSALSRWLDVRPEQGAERGVQVDLDTVQACLGTDDPAAARALITTFVQAARQGLDALEQNGDPEMVEQLVHAQTGGARILGASAYQELLGVLREKARHSPTRTSAADLAPLRKALRELELGAPRGEADGDLDAPVDAPPVGTGSVLIVDDDPVVVHQLEHLARNVGIPRVATVTGGTSALQFLRGNRVDVLVCDLQMPTMDGVEFLRELGHVGFDGGLILSSASDTPLLASIGQLATLYGLRVLGVARKPIRRLDLAALLASTRDARTPRRPVETIGSDDLRAALARGEITSWFQPKVHAVTLRAVGMEALARWLRPDGTSVSPQEFIGVAERAGMIGELSEVLLRGALRTTAEVRTHGFDVPLAFNLSARWLDDLSVPDLLRSEVSAAGLSPTAVTLEVTETSVIDDVSRALDVLTRLRLAGFGLAVDDFGTGYASLEQLRRFPFTELKLDRSFVSQAATDGAARSILEASVAMAAKLGLTTVAEGVETEEALAVVRSLGCSAFQGYLVARPMPTTSLLEWLEVHRARGAALTSGEFRR